MGAKSLGVTVAALLAANVFLVGYALPRREAAVTQRADTVRVRAFELVDERGRVRSRLNVEPGGDVVLRMMGENGTIRVKLGASEAGSGLVLMDEATEPAIHAIARRSATRDRPTTTGITVRDAAGRQQVVRP